MENTPKNDSEGLKKAPIHDFKSDCSILSYIIMELLPYSRKGQWVPFKQIMKSNSIVNHEIPEKDVFRILRGQISAALFRFEEIEGTDELKFRIDPSDFFTSEERQDPNWNIHILQKI